MTGATARRAGRKSTWSGETPADVLANAAGIVNRNVEDADSE
jgi:hypothetical protein